MLTKILESNNSSDEFWKTVKTLKKKELNDPSSNIQAKEWFEYFKNLMNTTHDKNSDFKSCTDDKFLNNCNKNLNVRITAEEVLLALKALKNKKSCGSDGLTNEMLKISCTMNVNMYVKLFNLILFTGIYPSKWRENYIKPVFKGGCFNNPSNYRDLESGLYTDHSPSVIKVNHAKLMNYSSPVPEPQELVFTEFQSSKSCHCSSDHAFIV
ncbi:unnamed protein product [Mytilus edulis]|uniref:Uncharacterized protein n=1 Tax=Mytilus edulis TaxID=6550 RepID=A0A8S3VIE9_MYTED|nr:unnamed protein product [Mytilus edulis]